MMLDRLKIFYNETILGNKQNFDIANIDEFLESEIDPMTIISITSASIPVIKEFIGIFNFVKYNLWIRNEDDGQVYSCCSMYSHKEQTWVVGYYNQEYGFLHRTKQNFQSEKKAKRHFAEIVKELKRNAENINWN